MRSRRIENSDTHPSTRPLRLIIAILLTFLLSTSLADTPENPSPHHFVQACSNCHDPVSSDNIDSIVGPITKNVNQLCSQSSCHVIHAKLSHPVNVVPSAPLPADMPLSKSSTVNCLTCHDEIGFGQETNVTPYFLRRPAGQLFCASCHQKLGKTIKEKTHWQFSTRAHLKTNEKREEMTTDFTESGLVIGTEKIDPESLNCLSCHEEITPSIPDDHETRRQKYNRWKTMSSHPIGMDFEQKKMDNRRAYLKNRMTLDPQIRFVDGRVGCISCHNMYNTTSKMNLSVRYEKGELCRQCHNK